MAIKLKAIVLATGFALSSYAVAADMQNPLPSWNNTDAKQAIVAFVQNNDPRFGFLCA